MYPSLPATGEADNGEWLLQRCTRTKRRPCLQAVFRIARQPSIPATPSRTAARQSAQPARNPEAKQASNQASQYLSIPAAQQSSSPSAQPDSSPVLQRPSSSEFHQSSIPLAKPSSSPATQQPSLTAAQYSSNPVAQNRIPATQQHIQQGSSPVAQQISNTQQDSNPASTAACKKARMQAGE